VHKYRSHVVCLDVCLSVCLYVSLCLSVSVNIFSRVANSKLTSINGSSLVVFETNPAKMVAEIAVAEVQFVEILDATCLQLWYAFCGRSHGGNHTLSSYLLGRAPSHSFFTSSLTSGAHR
jgi:hypothetical protein